MQEIIYVNQCVYVNLMAHFMHFRRILAYYLFGVYMGLESTSQVSYRTIQTEEVGQRLDNYLLRVLKGVPKSHIYRVIRSGEVRINMKRAKPTTRLQESDIVRIPPVRQTTTSVYQAVKPGMASCLLDSIIYEDASLLVLNKPSGIAVHGGSGVSLGVIEALRQLRPDLHYLELVHRLDRETSGCLLLAKKRSVLRAIQALLEARTVQKTYWALLANRWQGKETLLVDVALEKNILQSGERMVKTAASGKSSQTYFRLLENYVGACWVEAQPKTGRTHQIRVHSAYLEHPIIGDHKYGVKVSGRVFGVPERLYLHASAIEFCLDGQTYQFKAKLDDTFERALGVLRDGQAI